MLICFFPIAHKLKLKAYSLSLFRVSLSGISTFYAKKKDVYCMKYIHCQRTTIFSSLEYFQVSFYACVFR